MPKDEQQKIIDQLCVTYPAWFFELLTEIKSGYPTILENFQIGYLLDESRFKITNKTRQAGGSLIVSMAKFHKAYTTHGYGCDIVSINRSEAQGKIKYIRDLWESLPVRWRHPLELDNFERIGFYSGRNRSMIRSVAASAGVRGGKKDIVFDEAAHIPTFATTFVAALPATIRDSGGVDVVSTPMGRVGKFWDIWSNESGSFSNWSRHSFIWIDVSLFCTDCQEARRVWEQEFDSNYDALHGEVFERFAGSALREIAANLTSEEFLQEFCGVFVDESSAFFPYSLIDQCRVHVEPQPKADGVLDHTHVLKQWFVRPENNDQEITIGIDFAEGRKGGDSTSIQVVEKGEDGVIRLRASYDLLAGQGWNDFDKQINEMNHIISRFTPQKVRVDETGLGRQMAQDLKKEWGSIVEPITFHNALKEEMALNLKKLMEDQKLWIPWTNERLKGQIHNIKRKITGSGNIQYGGEPHDDMFWALALACKDTYRSRFRIFLLNE